MLERPRLARLNEEAHGLGRSPTHTALLFSFQLPYGSWFRREPNLPSVVDTHMTTRVELSTWFPSAITSTESLLPVILARPSVESTAAHLVDAALRRKGESSPCVITVNTISKMVNATSSIPTATNSCWHWVTLDGSADER